MLRIGRHLWALLPLAFCCIAGAADTAKILRVASPDIDTLDPQQFSDDPSFQVLMAVFEPLYEWDYLASPPKLTPLTAAGPLAITDDGKTWTAHLKTGIFFTDDPAFKGKPRELVAEDYVYSYKRWLDPNLRRGGAPITADLIVGMRTVVDAARKSGKFDYDRPVEGLRAIDRYTLQVKLTETNYPIIRDLFGFVGAAAREVVDAAGGDIRTRAVGTGPFRLREWKRGSRIVFDANPAYRRVRFPESDNPAQAALVRSMQGKILPQIGVVEVNIIDEDLPRVLQFEQGGLDYIGIRGEVANRLLADGALKPEYARRGITRRVFPEPFLFALYFNVADPVIGGLGSERIALRRAIASALDIETLVKVVYAGYALPANQMVPPGVGGHDATLPTKPLYDPATAKALLDRFGYAKGADGYRNTPDGKPLTVTLTLRSSPVSREIQTLTKRDLDAVGLRTDYRLTPFQDAIKELEKGQFQMYFGGFGGSPSGWPELFQLYSKQPQRVNVSQFKLDEYDRAAEKFLRSATDAEQVAAARKMTELARTYMPELPTIFRLQNDFVQPWLLGFSPQVFSTYWKYLDIDLARRDSAR
ncbi:MAG TPA: ABC transporter substrate-binding protein [Casimicrobiaceae bacterium]|nr:ABC transporter substrate-binding protein [Casimicrobiaceae bacterium]